MKLAECFDHLKGFIYFVRDDKIATVSLSNWQKLWLLAEQKNDKAMKQRRRQGKGRDGRHQSGRVHTQ